MYNFQLTKAITELFKWSRSCWRERISCSRILTLLWRDAISEALLNSKNNITPPKIIKIVILKAIEITTGFLFDPPSLFPISLTDLLHYNIIMRSQRPWHWPSGSQHCVTIINSCVEGTLTKRRWRFFDWLRRNTPAKI